MLFCFLIWYKPYFNGAKLQFIFELCKEKVKKVHFELFMCQKACGRRRAPFVSSLSAPYQVPIRSLSRTYQEPIGVYGIIKYSMFAPLTRAPHLLLAKLTGFYSVRLFRFIYHLPIGV